MNKNLERILIFAIGGIAGSLITAKIIDKKYAQIAEEEIESIRKMYIEKVGYANAYKSVNQIADEVIKEAQEQSISKEEYEKIIKDNNYIPQCAPAIGSLENIEGINYINDDVKNELEEYKPPYLIAPEEYGENPDYEMESLTLYADGILCNENNEKIEDIEDLLGSNLEHFGIYDDNSLFVRNDSRKHDYEIIKVEEKYSEEGIYFSEEDIE